MALVLQQLCGHLLLIYLAYFCHGQNHQYIKERGPNNEYIWRSKPGSHFIPMQSQSFGNITIGHIMSIEFDFIFGGRTNDPREGFQENFFRIGHTAMRGEYCDGEYSNYPSLWLSPDRNYLHITCSNLAHCQTVYSLSSYHTINIGIQHHMRIAFNDTKLTVHITGGGKPQWNDAFSREPTSETFIGVQVPVWWMSDKYSGTPYNKANGTFWNITITSYIIPPPTENPTINPTINPSSEPTPMPLPLFMTPTTKRPTDSPTNDPTEPSLSPTFAPSFPTIYQTDFPSWNPTFDPSLSPTIEPTPQPSPRPTKHPTIHPTMEPTLFPTLFPSVSPTADPTVDPTAIPTINPSADPTVDPTSDPTTDPTVDPTIDPTVDPTIDPTVDPTLDPTRFPTQPPTLAPSDAPSYSPSVAPTDAPSVAPTWSPTASVLEFDHELYTNMSLGCGTIYNRNTTKDKEFDYYRLDLSELDRIPKMIATTCCKSTPLQTAVTIDGVEYFLVANTTSFCDATSLDTVLYLLKYDIGKQQTTILTRHDDDTRIGFCHDGVNYGKSSIDVTSMQNMIEISDDTEYYIAVGGYTQNNEDSGYTLKTGKYQIELLCDTYIFPLDTAQFLSNIKEDNSHDIECGQAFENQMNTEYELVSYYYFDITKKTDTPIIVSTCDDAQQYNNYATYVYIASIQYYRQEASGFTILKQETLDQANCESDIGGIDITSLDIDKYIIVVGGFNSTDPDNFGNLEAGNFSVSVICGYPPDPFDTIALIVLLSVVIGLIICCCICFWVWYCRTLRKYKQKHPEFHRKSSGHKRVLSDSESFKLNTKKKAKSSGDVLHMMSQSIELKEIEDDSAAEVDNYSLAVKPIQIKQSKSAGDVIGPRYRGSIGAYSPVLNQSGFIAGRHLHEEDMDEHPDMDMIIAVMQDIIASCEDESDLDVYQVLAFRRLDDKSKRLKLIQPLKMIGSDYELLNLSPWHISIFVALVVAGLQVFGITIILYSVTYEYFTDPTIHSECTWQPEYWADSWMFKILAFFWALVITLSLATTLKALTHTGFNQIIERMEPDDHMKLDISDVGIVYMGYLINLYTLLLAVFGSYFLVYSSEQGSGAIDMVLNAVALFFMIELDDLLVSHGDYKDISEAASEFLKEYIERKKRTMEETDDTKDEEEHETKQCFKKEGLKRVAKLVEHLVFMIQFMAVFGGFVAPFGILVCFG